MTEGMIHFDNCPSCGRRVSPDDRFCAECGRDLSQKTCPTCDVINDLGANFCTACGATLTVAAPPIVVPAPAAPEPQISQIETAAESEVVAGPPDDWEPPSSEDLEIPDVRSAFSESTVGDPLPFEPRTVPATGMPAWNRADAATQPDTKITGGAELIVVRRNGAWAYALGENGWKGWVDDRLLVDPDLAPSPVSPPGPAPIPAAQPASGSAPTATPPASGAAPARKGLSFITRPFTTAGAIAAVIAIFVPWTRFDSGFSAFDTPVTVLFSSFGGESVVSIGIILLGLGGFAGAIALVPGLAKLSNLLLLLGVGLVAVGGLFIYQLARIPFLDVSDFLAAGPIVTIAAGVLVLTRR